MLSTQSAGGIVIGPQNKILLIKQFGNFLSYSLPKGQIKKNENILDAARREINEEGGVSQLELIKSLGSYERPNLFDPDETKTIFMFLFRTDQTELTSRDPDKDTQPFWAEIDGVKNLLTHPKDKEFYRNCFDEIQNFFQS